MHLTSITALYAYFNQQVDRNRANQIINKVKEVLHACYKNKLDGYKEYALFLALKIHFINYGGFGKILFAME